MVFDLLRRLRSKSGVRGQCLVELFDEHGRLKERRLVKNLIVNNGKYAITEQLLDSPSIAKPSHMGIGTGTTAPAATDTALGAEVGTRVTVTKSRSNNVLTLSATFGAGNGTGAITEAGIFNAATAGTMYSRITFSVINKGRLICCPAGL
ncbi:MAG: hypothetical protein ACPLPR_02225 [Bacillota bacterium]